MKVNYFGFGTVVLLILGIVTQVQFNNDWSLFFYCAACFLNVFNMTKEEDDKNKPTCS